MNELADAMKTELHRALMCLCVAVCAGSPSMAGAQPPAVSDRNDPGAQAKAYACVDPSDALARRWLQDEPCKLPMYQLPVTAVARVNEAQRWPTYLPRSPEAQEGHTMFWRFPVQPMGPYEVPRHSRR